MKAYLQSFRPTHWLKNLVFIAPFYIQQNSQFSTADIIIGLFVWCIVSSGQYVTNDIIDLSSDKSHPTKRLRPLASHKLSLNCSLWAGISLWLIGLILASQMPLIFFLSVSLYVVFGLFYSIFFKQIFLLDVICLAILFLLRFISGLDFLQWSSFLEICIFIFLYFFNLALLKRLTEIELSLSDKITGRNYFRSNRKLLVAFGITSSVFLLITIFLTWVSEPILFGGYLLAFELIAFLYLTHLWLAFFSERMRGELYHFVVRSPLTHMLVIACGIYSIYDLI